MLRFRFGVVFTGHYDQSGWAEMARRVEGEGFSTLLVADHYANPMACGPLLMAAAAATSDLRIGSYVYNNDFRPPALLAKEAATIDVLSGGRMELGLGAGWAKLEYVAAGVHFDPPGTRVDRLEEAVGIIRRLLAGETVDHRGDHYRLRGLPGEPQALQDPVPLLLGGGGRRMVRLAARLGDIIGFVPQALPEGGLEASGNDASWMDTRVGWLEEDLCALPRTTPLERSVLLFGVGPTASESPELSRMDADTLTNSPFALVGDIRQMVATLQERRERWGLSYLVCFDHDRERLAPVVSELAGS